VLALTLDPAVHPTVSVDEAAKVLAISRGTAYEGIRTGQIPSIRIGGRIRVPTAALRRMLQLDPVPSAADDSFATSDGSRAS
jgi:excisionase family DNA binding protein